jgi:hypothetical protein
MSGGEADDGSISNKSGYDFEFNREWTPMNPTRQSRNHNDVECGDPSPLSAGDLSPSNGAARGNSPNR